MIGSEDIQPSSGPMSMIAFLACYITQRSHGPNTRFTYIQVNYQQIN